MAQKWHLAEKSGTKVALIFVIKGASATLGKYPSTAIIIKAKRSLLGAKIEKPPDFRKWGGMDIHE